MKKILPIIIIVVVLGVVVLERHAIKNMLMGSSATPNPEAMTAQPTAMAAVSPAAANNIYSTKTDATKGNYLADFAGMSLYVYDKDTTDTSNCTAGCATAWPSYTSGATAQGTFPENISVIKRADGSSQFAWKGMPLYYFAKDKAAGDVSGDGVGGVWHLVKP